jgi:hypothetical protein
MCVCRPIAYIATVLCDGLCDLDGRCYSLPGEDESHGLHGISAGLRAILGVPLGALRNKPGVTGGMNRAKARDC